VLATFLLVKVTAVTSLLQAVVSRLNHEPFKYVITINANKPVRGIVRIFLTPKINWFGQKVPLEVSHWGVIELDRFPVKRE
jgi:hypothetical protein